MTEIAASLAELPDDRREAVPQDLHGSYRRLDQSLQQIHVEATYDVAVALGAALTTPARLGRRGRRLRHRTSTANDASCLDAFIKRFGARALRRPLETDEVAFYTTAYGASATASAAALRRSDRPARDRARVHLLRRARRQALSPGNRGATRSRLTSWRRGFRTSSGRRRPTMRLLAAAADGSLRRRRGLRAPRCRACSPIRARARRSTSSSPTG